MAKIQGRILAKVHKKIVHRDKEIRTHSLTVKTEFDKAMGEIHRMTA